MKWVILFLLVMNFALSSFGQRAGEAYALITDSRVQVWNDATQQPDNDSTIYYRAERGNIFTVKEKVFYRIGMEVITGYRVVFWNFADGKQVPPIDPPGFEIILVKNTAPGMVFFISDPDLAAKTTSEFRKPNGFFTVNAVLIPVKLRFANRQPGGIFDFTQSISVGPVVSKTWNKGGAFGSSSISVLFGVNVTNVSVDEKTAPGIVTSKTTLFGLSPVIGFNAEYRGVNFGVLTGIDIVTGDAAKIWAYRKSPWFGFSIGTSLFTTTPVTPTQ